METLRVQAQIRQNSEEISSFLTDLGKWEKSIKIRDKQLRRQISETGSVKVPSTTVFHPENKEQSTLEGRPTIGKESAAKHTYDIGYAKWEKFDADAEQIDKPDVIANSKPSSESNNSDLTPATLVRKFSTLPQVPLAAVPKARRSANMQDAELVERERGNNEFKCGNFIGAVKAYTICLGLKAKNFIAFSNRAMAYLKMKEFSRAETDCNCALSIEPQHTKSLMRRASARNMLGKHRSALTDLLAVISLEPSNKQCRADIQRTKELIRSAVNRAPLVAFETAWEGQASSTEDNESLSGPDLPSYVGGGKIGLIGYNATSAEAPVPPPVIVADTSKTLGPSIDDSVPAPSGAKKKKSKPPKSSIPSNLARVISGYELQRRLIESGENRDMLLALFQGIHPSACDHIFAGLLEADVIHSMIRSLNICFGTGSCSPNAELILDWVGSIGTSSSCQLLVSLLDTNQLREISAVLDSCCNETTFERVRAIKHCFHLS